METENIAPAVEPKKSVLTSVTPFSKYLALLLFIVMPFIGGWVGYHYAPEKQGIEIDENYSKLVLENLQIIPFSEDIKPSYIKKIIPSQTGNVTRLYIVTDTNKVKVSGIGHHRCYFGSPGNGNEGISTMWATTDGGKRFYIFDPNEYGTSSKLYSYQVGSSEPPSVTSYEFGAALCSVRLFEHESGELVFGAMYPVPVKGFGLYTDFQDRFHSFNKPYNYFISSENVFDPASYAVVETWNSGTHTHTLYAIDSKGEVINYCQNISGVNIACEIAGQSGSKYYEGEAEILTDMNAIVFFDDGNFVFSDLSGSQRRSLVTLTNDVPEPNQGEEIVQLSQAELRHENSWKPRVVRSADGRYLILHAEVANYPSIDFEVGNPFQSVLIPEATSRTSSLHVYDLLKEEIIFSEHFDKGSGILNDSEGHIGLQFRKDGHWEKQWKRIDFTSMTLVEEDNNWPYSGSNPYMFSI